tara:strand:- start:37 stop:1083 length:1047 start_codon:yes stop_codon:yes gene_type:complete
MIKSRDVKVFGTKTSAIDVPSLDIEKQAAWFSEIEGFVRNLTQDGCLANVMFGMQQYVNMQVHSKAITKIYDVLIVAIKGSIPSATIPVRIRDARDGVALAGFIWNHLEGSSKRKYKQKLFQFNQQHEDFHNMPTIEHGIGCKLALADEVNQLASSAGKKNISELQICDTILEMLPENDSWVVTRDHFSSKKTDYDREELLNKVKERLVVLGVKAKTDIGSHLSEEANYTGWNKSKGKNANYGDPEYLFGKKKGKGQMDDKQKKLALVQFIVSQDKPPHLDRGAYLRFMKFCEKMEFDGDKAHLVMKAFIEPGDFVIDELNEESPLEDSDDESVDGGGAIIGSSDDDG